MISLLITGSSGFIGSKLTRIAENTPGFDRILGIDCEDPPLRFSRARFIKADIRHPLLHNIIQSNNIDTIMHLAFALPPKHSALECHEMNIRGSMKLLHACRKSNVRRIILLSCSTVYGAHFDSPFYMTEEHQIRPVCGELSGQDKAEVEKIFLQFQEKNPATDVIIIRSAPICGSLQPSYLSPILNTGVSPHIMGFNPLVQVINEEDCLEVLKRAMSLKGRGIFNLVADGAIPLRKLIRIFGAYTAPVSQLALSVMTELLWNLKLTSISSEQLRFLKYQCTIDNSKIKKTFYFQPRFSTEESIIHLSRRKRIHTISQPDDFMQAGFITGEQEKQ